MRFFVLRTSYLVLCISYFVSRTLQEFSERFKIKILYKRIRDLL
jgi:hypothetical protein